LQIERDRKRERERERERGFKKCVYVCACVCDRVREKDIQTEIEREKVNNHLLHLPSTPPSLQNSSRACLKARMEWVGGVKRN
jgi:hypothetical protein